MRRAYYVAFGCLAALTLFWAFTKYQTFSSIVSILQQPQSWIGRSRASSDKAVSDYYSSNNYLSDLPKKGYLSREEALRYPPLTDIQNAVSMKRSLVKILERDRPYLVGEKIVMSVTLIEENGGQRELGGDKLHVRIFNTAYGAYAPGHVTDHGNGSYTVEIPALWPGVSIVSIYLAHPRDDIRVMYATMQQNFSTRQFLGRYESGVRNETVLCQPATEYFPPLTGLCDFTQVNGDMSWYCAKPTDNQLQCSDFASIRAYLSSGYFLQTAAEKVMFRHQDRTVRNFTVRIAGALQSRDELPDCFSVPRTETWMKHIPSGYFYNDKWHPTFCRLPDDKQCDKRVFGRHFAFFGDSTVRQWYTYMIDNLHCRQVTERWTMKAWHKLSMCVNKSLNFSTTFIPHERPLFSGDYWRKYEIEEKYTLAYLDAIQRENVVIVLHMFSHLTHYRTEIFQDRMNMLSSGVRRLLNRHTIPIVLIKGPHTFNSILSYKYYTYRLIIKEAFKGLHDRVVFMEQGDMTIAKHNKALHPDIGMVREAIRQLMGFIG